MPKKTYPVYLSERLHLEKEELDYLKTCPLRVRTPLKWQSGKEIIVSAEYRNDLSPPLAMLHDAGLFFERLDFGESERDRAILKNIENFAREIHKSMFFRRVEGHTYPVLSLYCAANKFLGKAAVDFACKLYSLEQMFLA